MLRFTQHDPCKTQLIYALVPGIRVNATMDCACKRRYRKTQGSIDGKGNDVLSPGLSLGYGHVSAPGGGRKSQQRLVAVGTERGRHLAGAPFGEGLRLVAKRRSRPGPRCRDGHQRAPAVTGMEPHRA